MVIDVMSAESNPPKREYSKGHELKDQDTLKRGSDRASPIELDARLDALTQIITEEYSDGRKIIGKEIIKKMKELGYPEYTKDTLYRDRCRLNRKNPFLRDMAESNYSKIVEEMWNDIELVNDKAKELLEDAKTAEKKRSVGRLILETVELRDKILNGNVMDVSLSLLSNKLDKLENDNRKLEIENEDLKKKKYNPTVTPDDSKLL